MKDKKILCWLQWWNICS